MIHSWLWTAVTSEKIKQIQTIYIFKNILVRGNILKKFSFLALAAYWWKTISGLVTYLFNNNSVWQTAWAKQTHYIFINPAYGRHWISWPWKCVNSYCMNGKTKKSYKNNLHIYLQVKRADSETSSFWRPVQYSGEPVWGARGTNPVEYNYARLVQAREWGL